MKQQNWRPAVTHTKDLDEVGLKLAKLPKKMMQLDEVKKVLKSLLVAVSGGMSVANLDREFREMEGRRIPYREFNFNSVTEFLSSMPDTLSVSICIKKLCVFAFLGIHFHLFYNCIHFDSASAEILAFSLIATGALWPTKRSSCDFGKRQSHRENG